MLDIRHGLRNRPEIQSRQFDGETYPFNFIIEVFCRYRSSVMLSYDLDNKQTKSKMWLRVPSLPKGYHRIKYILPHILWYMWSLIRYG